ncbi:MAG: GNAT family N-acetyltransferase [Clostridia bacterium]|nr:GNAT family N-acetyltransferase [Clostridia bacterium]
MSSFREKLLALPAELFCGEGEKVGFRPIRTEAELVYAIFDCSIPAEQQELVNPAGFSIGRAYLDPDNNLPCLIIAEGRPVGFISLLRWRGKGDAVSWSYYIDEREQGRGFGKASAAKAVHLLNAAFPEKPIKLSAEEANRKAHALYRSLGFVLLDEKDGDDLVFCRPAMSE